jgi:hypothetical protein
MALRGTNLEMSKDKIKGSIASFIAVVLAFTGGWYYLDQQRLAMVKEQQEVMKLKIEAEHISKSSQEIERRNTEREKRILEREKIVEQRYKEQSRDNELSELTLKFINEVSDIDIYKSCGDDLVHNAKGKKGQALLNLIEAKASEYGRKDILGKFVKRQRGGLLSWHANCRRRQLDTSEIRDRAER